MNTSNWGLKILSLILAIVIWWLINSRMHLPHEEMDSVPKPASYEFR